MIQIRQQNIDMKKKDLNLVDKGEWCTSCKKKLEYIHSSMVTDPDIVKMLNNPKKILACINCDKIFFYAENKTKNFCGFSFSKIE